MCSSKTEVTLEIQGIPITCHKEDLISNSDYFKAMFEGNFVESNKSKVTIEGIDVRAMNIILTLLWDDSYSIEEENILSVLQASSMLQFERIKRLCIEQITEILSPKNCVKIWITTEQLDIKPLYLKAKFLALNEFVDLKYTESICYLTFQELCNYLGHINLRTDNEFSVFQTAMRWWYENNKQTHNILPKSLLKLLSCVSFSDFSEQYLKEAKVYPDIKDNQEMIEILSCIEKMKLNKSTESVSHYCHTPAMKLLSSKPRIIAMAPCMVVNSVDLQDVEKMDMGQGEEQRVIYYDNFKRKRFYENIDRNRNNLVVLLYDIETKKFRKFFEIDHAKCHNLEGFKLLHYKQFAFMYGGEHLIGRGKWNMNFWMYDSLRDRWERKTTIPAPRRHFETCVVGSRVFIAGGTGTFRVTQESLFWYDYKKDHWSKERILPIYDRQMRCCCFLDQFILFSINENCAYFLKDDGDSFTWTKMEVVIDRTVLSNQSEFCIFSYKDRLFIKGKNLIELGIIDNKMMVISIKHVTDRDCDKMDVAVCVNIVYTLYKHRFEENDVYSLETYNLDTEEYNYIFENIQCGSILEADKEKYQITTAVRLFSFEHYCLLDHSTVVNDFE